MKLFEEGISLVNECSDKLNETKKKIEIIMEKNGKIDKENFVEDKKENEENQTV